MNLLLGVVAFRSCSQRKVSLKSWWQLQIWAYYLKIGFMNSSKCVLSKCWFFKTPPDSSGKQKEWKLRMEWLATCNCTMLKKKKEPATLQTCCVPELCLGECLFLSLELSWRRFVLEWACWFALWWSPFPLWRCPVVFPSVVSLLVLWYWWHTFTNLKLLQNVVLFVQLTLPSSRHYNDFDSFY